MKRISLQDPYVWNTWRALYNSLTDEEQFAFANECEEAYPHQIHHNKQNFDFLFKDVDGVKVLEIGGWKGELAQHCLAKYSIASWNNVDVCSNAVDKTVSIDRTRYASSIPKQFRWFLHPRQSDYDVCVSAHTIEHFSNEDMLSLIKHISGVKTVMFDAPLKMEGDDWHGYGGTHMLTMGWRGVNAAMVAEGYAVEEINKHCFLYKSTVP